MNILFCGSCLPRKFEVKIKDLSVAGNQYQNNLIKHLKGCGNVKILSFINIDVDLSLDEVKKECEKEDITPIFFKENKSKAIIDFRKKMKEEIKWADKIIVYNILYPWMGLPKIANKYNKKSIIIGADFTPPEECQNFVRKVYSKLIEKEFSKYRKVVMLSEGFNRYLKHNQEKEVINGCIEWEKFKEICQPSECKVINIAYTGLISKYTGVNLLVDSFIEIDNPNLRLIISGQEGDLTEYINKVAENDNRIQYKGFVTKEEYYEILQDSHIVVNPRNMNYLQNRTNFPSKVLEYIASGRIVISTKFNGYEKYEKYIKFVDSNIDDIKREIVSSVECAIKDPKKIYSKNRNFIKMYTWENQINKYL